ncbi:MAG: polymer-forming cytoskeletal protein [Lachnospiraceae bacterium]|nr:polymer-forming cytoskeletal protein [Lachnospiraceae bacterium]
MLGKKKDFSNEKINSIIGADAIIEGTFTTKDTTRIDGIIKGNVETKGTLLVGKSGKIEGKIQAANIMIAGEVIGDLHITERIEATATSKIMGDIVAKSLSIDEKAKFEGRCTMNMNNVNSKTKEDAEIKNDTKMESEEIKTEDATDVEK